jgi:hypothetical protein
MVWKVVTLIFIFSFFSNTTTYKKSNEKKKAFIEYIVLVLVKRLLPLSTLENIWMKWFGLQRGSHLLFPLHKNVIEEIITLYYEVHTWKVSFPLCQCYVSITTFDLWMNKGALDTFALVINFLTLGWNQNMS